MEQIILKEDSKMKSTKKHFTCAAIAAATLLSALHVCAETTTPRWGDVNADGKVGLEDAQTILLYYVQVGLGGTTGPEIDVSYADVNLDGAIDVSDAQLTLVKYVREMSGLTYLLPAENGGTAKVIAQKWAVYSAPTTSLEARLVDVIRPGESFEILQAASIQWYQVKLQSGDVGFIHVSKQEFENNFSLIIQEDTETTTTTETVTTTTATETATTTTATETTTTMTATETTTTMTATETTTTTMTATETTTTATENTTTTTETTSSATETTVTTEAPKPKELFSEGDTIVFQKTAWNVYDSELKGIIAWLRNGEELTIESAKNLHDDVQLYEISWIRDGKEMHGFIYNGEAGFFVKK
jgi:hypothetical protein